MSSKKILRYFVCFSCILLLSVNGFSKKKINESSWTDNPLKVDGKTDDWKDVKMNELKNYVIDYAFRNDNNNLYIIFIFKDYNFISTISSSGMTVWMNSVNKKSKAYGIKMIKRMITPGAFIALVEKKHGPLSDKQKNDLKKRKFYSIYQSGIINKEDEAPVPIKLASDKSPSFRVNSTKSAMVYEFRIPLAKIEGEVAGIGTLPGNEIMIGFEWGGKTKESEERAKQRGRGYRGQSSKGGVSSSMPGSGEWGGRDMGAGSSPSSRTRSPYWQKPKKYTVWTAVKLAVK